MNKKINTVIQKSKLGRNTAPKIISLVFAIVFWVYVMDQVNPEIIKVYDDIPVEVVGIEQIENDGLILMSDPSYEVSITVTGRRNDLLSFDESLLLVTADVRGYQKGLNTVPIEKRVLIDNVAITDISRSDIKVELDQVVSQSKLIEVVTTGEMSNGLTINHIEKDKIEVVVTGPETEVNKINALKGEINISEITDDFSTEISLIPVDIEGNQVMNVELLESSVECLIEVDKTRSIPLIANFTETVDDGYQLVNIILTPKSVQVLGDVETVSNLKSLYTSEIDLSQIMEPTSLELSLNLPSGVEVTSLEGPVLADVIVEKIETKEFIFNLNEVAYTNLSELYDLEILERVETLDVILKDIGSKLENVGRGDIELIVDLEGVGPGEYELPIEVLTGVSIKSIELSEELISLEIKEKE